MNSWIENLDAVKIMRAETAVLRAEVQALRAELGYFKLLLALP
jgi:hypothetical protein